MQRRIEQTNAYGAPLHDLEEVDEILTLDRQQTLQSGFAIIAFIRKNHLAHGGQTILFKEHMLGAAKPDPLRLEIAGG